MSPRALSALPDHLLQEMAEILNECERTGEWPEQWRLAIIVLLPKPDGGRRPIGLFPAPVRVWMRARAPELRKWEQDNSRESLYGSSGKAATRAAWLSAWEAENAGKGEGAYAQALMDLVKAFESVPHRQLWEAAERRGYPMTTLRLALAAYAMPRSISSDGAFSRLVSATRGITAGSGTATAELRALTLDLIDALAEEFPEVVQAVYVDDVNLELRKDADNTRFPRPSRFLPLYLAKKLGIARARHITNIITDTTNTVARATTRTVAYFQSLGMEVSASKSMVTASTPTAAKLLEALVPQGIAKTIHARTGQPAKMLGVGTKGGSVRTTKIYNKRVQQFKKKVHRFRTLKNCGFATRYAVQATAMPAVGYGLETAGISNTALRQLRCMPREAATSRRN